MFAETYGWTPRDVDELTVVEFEIFCEHIKAMRRANARAAGRRRGR